jgi:DNA invertase Pin-like site-specific DNA recombinase
MSLLKTLDTLDNTVNNVHNGNRRRRNMLVIGYTRVSSQGQADHGVSLAGQDERIRQWCELHGHELVKVYTDAGLSGGRADNRPGLCDALKEARRLKATLVVFNLSRLSRSLKDALQIVSELTKAGAELVSLSEEVDTTSAAGKMMFQIQMAVNEHHRNLTGELTSAALRHLRSNHMYTGGAVRYGYRVEDDGKNLVEDAGEQAVLQVARDLREAGYGLKRIAKELHARGFASRTGRTFQPIQIRNMVKAA